MALAIEWRPSEAKTYLSDSSLQMLGRLATKGH